MDPAPAKNESASRGGTRPRLTFHWRGFTSFLLLMIGSALTASGAVLFIAPRGRTADWNQWTCLGWTKQPWISLHLNLSIVFTVLVVAHILFNGRVLIGYLYRKSEIGIHRKGELLLAALVALLCVAGSLWLQPPFDGMPRLRHTIQDRWDRDLPQAPPGRLEAWTLQQLAERFDLPVDDLVFSLQQEGYMLAAPDRTLARIAAGRGVSPAQVYADVRKHFPVVEPGRGAGRGPGRGARQRQRPTPEANPSP